MNKLERDLINNLQGGFPICTHPFQVLADRLGYHEETIIDGVKKLISDGYVSRFGPLYNTERLGGAVTLAAIAVPLDRFDEVAEQVNAFDEVAHNYAREDALNMWFVILAEDEKNLQHVITRIENATGLRVLSFPKEREYFLELHLEVPDQ
ncbi:Lrp/AsnC family transcriptional regulator [Thalassospira xianhensis]|uniref:siroheme decarboxylase n=1 Tax=Thalassospira xianhensis MCCC 1A02616 TaxID=1177929 RepID=A0A367U926_9PROT|nr:Lrp/AsnC family transcriptional regulator [Thalassospira xianhensis]RCK03804.1 protein nirG [Thalassospira xianhensis MCCC 1A02616]